VTDKCGWRKEDGSFEYTQSTNPVSEESVRHLKQLLTSQHFWNMERHRRINMEDLVADGTNWLLEVASDGNYKYVYRHEPDPQEDKLCDSRFYAFDSRGF